MSNKAKVARLVPETPDNSSSDDENEPEGEELQVRSAMLSVHTSDIHMALSI